MKKKEAIQILETQYQHDSVIREALKTLIPEFRESDDERTRKRLIEFISDIKRISESGRNSCVVRNSDVKMCNAFLSYLEKQKEPKREFHIPDYMGMAYYNPAPIELKEQKPELVQQPPITYTYNSNASRDERLKAALLALLNSDLLKVKEGGYFTNQDLIEWVERIPTENPSEKDEKMLADISWAIRHCAYDDKKKERVMKWFNDNYRKFLRPSWKPSEKQPDVDFEKEIDRWFGEQYMQNMVGLPNKPIVQIIARHFYELGLNARKV